jgi:predicted aldo/keto reductase-like oxidoreductase
MYNDTRHPRWAYKGNIPGILKEEARADKCIECGECVEKCPQKLQIPELLKKAHEYLSAKG